MMAERTSAAQSTISDSSSSSGNQDEDSTRVLESLSSQDSNGTCTEGHDEDTPLVLGADDDDSNKNDKVKDQVDNNNGHNNTGSTSGGSGFAGKPRRASILKSGKPKVKKSVSFCSMPEDRRVSNAKDCLALMQEGTELTKLKPNGRLYRRYYWLDNDLSEIRWMPTSKSYNKAKILVDQIKEVQSGKTSDVLRNKDIENMYQEEYMLTILYGSNYTPLDLVAKSPDEANIWIAGLTHLISKRDHILNGHANGDESPEWRASMRDRWLSETYAAEAGTTDDLMPECDVINLILRINPAVDTLYINLKLKELYSAGNERVNSKGVLNCDEFICLYKDVASRQEIYFLMTKYGNSHEYMNAEELMLFLETEQGKQDVSKRYCEELISRYEPSREGKAKLMLGIDGLLAYLLSNECDIFNPSLAGITHDMTQSLSHYFINASHKTYLLEDQLKGPSSATAYSRALRLGCRYIEVDCWDGTTEPIVYHGRTLTSKILFSEVIETVNKNAFLTSPYPVILSIENHCSLEQQQILVNIVKSTFGDKLYSTPINGNAFNLPSPEQLKHKILLKCKKIIDGGELISISGEVSEEDESLDPDWRRLNRKEPSKKMEMLRELSDLVIWCQSCSYDKFANQRSTQKPWHVTSVSDLYAQKLMQMNGEELIACNRQCLIRVYPNCSRVDSSNYNPQEMWNYGCQIAAINQQTQGFCFDLNIARFKQNGNCGYVLKPALLREPGATLNPQALSLQNLPGITPQVLQIKVISGHRFPKPKGSGTKSHITDPYVLIEIFGISSDCTNARTKTVPGNGQNPFFDESFTFYVNFPEMALIRFNILDDDFIGDEFIAQYTIPFNCINTGFRHINLLSSCGDRISGCTLFVHITTTEAFDKKPIKRGMMSSSKLRVVKEMIVVKPVGVRGVDEASKCLMTTLTDLSELRYNVENSLVKFKEACDVGSVANIKYCIRTIANRAASTKGLTLKLVSSAHLPTFVVSEGTPPDILKKALQSYLVWCKECKSLIDEGLPRKKTLLEIESALLIFQREMNGQLEVSSLSDKKSQKASENLSWNVRILREQLSSLDQYTETCKTSFIKVIEAAQATGMEVVAENGVIT